MTNPGARSSRAEQRRNTEARILKHARALFAEAGYDRTTIRAVAAAAGVDPGLVMHYFGSKEKLFAQAIEAGAPSLSGGTRDDVVVQLVGHLRESLAEAPVESLAVLRSMLTHPEAAHEIRVGSRVDRERISRAIGGDDAELRAATLSAVLIGLVLGRHLVKLDPLADADPGQVAEILRPAIRAIVKADP